MLEELVTRDTPVSERMPLLIQEVKNLKNALEKAFENGKLVNSGLFYSIGDEVYLCADEYHIILDNGGMLSICSATKKIPLTEEDFEHIVFIRKNFRCGMFIDTVKEEPYHEDYLKVVRDMIKNYVKVFTKTLVHCDTPASERLPLLIQEVKNLKNALGKSLEYGEPDNYELFYTLMEEVYLDVKGYDIIFDDGRIIAISDRTEEIPLTDEDFEHIVFVRKEIEDNVFLDSVKEELYEDCYDELFHDYVKMFHGDYSKEIFLSDD